MGKLFSILLLLLPGMVSAATFTVGAQSNGGYGQTLTSPEPFEPLVLGPSLLAGQEIAISVSGDIALNETVSAGADGVPFDFGTAPESRSPLQETAGVFGGVEPNSGALVGYFAPAGLLPLDAFDSERGGDLPASGLFLIGSSATFLAPEAGTLFFGINDPRVSNNSGSFLVEVVDAPVSEVPLPAGALLLLTGIGALGLRRKL